MVRFSFIRTYIKFRTSVVSSLYTRNTIFQHYVWKYTVQFQSLLIFHGSKLDESFWEFLYLFWRRLLCYLIIKFNSNFFRFSSAIFKVAIMLDCIIFDTHTIQFSQFHISCALINFSYPSITLFIFFSTLCVTFRSQLDKIHI